MNGLAVLAAGPPPEDRFVEEHPEEMATLEARLNRRRNTEPAGRT